MQLFSYSKEEINKMVTEEKFLQSLDQYQYHYYFEPEKLLLNDKNIYEEESSKSLQLI